LGAFEVAERLDHNTHTLLHTNVPLLQRHETS